VGLKPHASTRKAKAATFSAASEGLAYLDARANSKDKSRSRSLRNDKQKAKARAKVKTNTVK
jgi:hypothetical protein